MKKSGDLVNGTVLNNIVNSTVLYIVLLEVESCEENKS